MARVFVTGGTGFIGQRVVERLLRDGHDVVCSMRPRSFATRLEQKVRDLPGSLRFVVADVGIPDTLAAPIHDTDYVIHLAAMLKTPWDPQFMFVNADGTRNIFEHASEVKTPPTVIFVSSVAASGPAPIGGAPRRESDPAVPVSRYGESKFRAEQAALLHAAKVPTTIIRPPAVFGPDDKTSFALFETASKGLALVPTMAEPRMSMVHVDDLAWGIVAAMERGQRVAADPASAPGQGIYFLAHRETPRMAEVGRWIGEGLGRKVRVLHVPRWLTLLGGAVAEAVARLRGRAGILNFDKAREATAGSWTVAIDQAERDLGFAPPTAMRERLAETARWYQAEGWLPKRS